MEKWVEAAYANSQQVQIAQANVALAVKEVDRARYGHYPTLDAVASANYNNQGDSPTFSTGHRDDAGRGRRCSSPCRSTPAVR